jgi:hypothetical protein
MEPIPGETDEKSEDLPRSALAPTPSKPTVGDVFLLVAMQVGIAALGVVIVALLPFHVDAGSWIGALGAMAGAQTFAMLREQRRPGSVDRAFAHRLALLAAAGHMALGLAFGAAAWIVVPETIAPLLQLGAWIAPVAIVLGGAIGYGATRLGVNLGLKNAKKRATTSG